MEQTLLKSEELIFKLTDFIQKYLHYTDRDLIKDYILQHQKYGTCDYELDKNGEVIYVARWNIAGNKAEIIDFAVAKEYRNKRFIKYVMLKNLLKYLPQYPQVRFLQWGRGQKYPDRKKRIYSIYELVRRKI